MAIELRQQLKLTQQLVMTPQLQMAIKLLQLSRLELVDMIRQELEENPALEEAQEAAEEEREMDQKEVDAQAVSIDDSNTGQDEEKIHEDIDWNVYLEEYNSPGRINYEFEAKEAPRYETFIAAHESLSEHLLWQLLMSRPTEEEERIGSLVIGNLNKDGYLEPSVSDLAAAGPFPVENVEKVLEMLQTFDPVGVCARNIQECLLIQARHYQIENPTVLQIIQGHLKNLENKNYKAIAKALKIPFEEVVAAVKVIKSLEPRPGRQFSDEEPVYINPDIYVYKLEDEFIIVLNDDGMPKLRINSYYKDAISRGEKVNGAAKEYIQEKMRSATWLIRSIHQRQKTIYRVMESIVSYQRDFFEKGIEHLKPMVLRDVAQDINMHESTISRVTTNKYAYTPQGIFELKYFFNSSINRIHGGVIASTSVMEKIKHMIENEDPHKPLSDSKIADLLKKNNIDIARRTVAKYREILKVLPSNKRKCY